MIKRIMSCFLAATLLFTAIPMEANGAESLSANDYVQSVSDNFVSADHDKIQLGEEYRIEFSDGECVYDGFAQRPGIRVIHKETEEALDKSYYGITYSNNIRAGEALVTVSGRRNYEGSLTAAFSIKKAQLTIAAKDITVAKGQKADWHQLFQYEIRGLAPMDELLEEPDYRVTTENTDKTGYYEIYPKDALADENYQEEILYLPGKISIVEDFWVSEILPQTYTGKAVKPPIQVYDQGVLLRPNKDYRVTYKNNINANYVPEGEEFSSQLPTAIIEGRGNYQGTISVNFTILPAKLTQENGKIANKVKLNCKEQLTVNTKKEQKTLTSLSFHKKLKENVDYEATLLPIKAFDAQGNPMTGALEGKNIPKGCSGEFSLEIQGKGNYTGKIVKKIVVSNKDYLLKNAKITLGKNVKSLSLLAYKEEGGLKSGYYDSEKKKYYPVEKGRVDTRQAVDKVGIYTVKCGKNELIEGKDFQVFYENDSTVGKATLILRGMGQYVGEKSITFHLTGEKLTAKNLSVQGITEQSYTGRPITFKNLKVAFKDKTGQERELVLGRDYRLSYEKNVQAGTASVTIAGMEKAGYEGKVKKSFKILPLEMERVIVDEQTNNLVLPFEKTGVKPIEQVGLKNSFQKALVYGKDYTLSYENNKAVADREHSTKPPTIVVKGKGNYSGQLRNKFTIEPGSLKDSRISISVTPLPYQPGKKDNATYKPKVVVKDNKTTLSNKKDYTVEYRYNTQKDYRNYHIDKTAAIEQMPVVIIKPKEGGNYDSPKNKELILPLPIYRDKFTKKNLYAAVSSISYNKGQAAPQADIYYSPGNKALKMKGVTDIEELQQIDPEVEKLSSEQYRIEFGKNLTVGANKGTLKVMGDGITYGGSITFRFTIDKRQLNLGEIGDSSEGGEGGEPTQPEGGEGGEPTQPEGGEGGEPTQPEGGEGGEPTPPEGGEGGEPTPPEGGEGGEPQVIPTDPIVTEKSFYARDDTFENYDSLKSMLKEQMVPLTIKEILEDFPNTFGYLDGSDIGIGLQLFFGEYSSTYQSILGYVSFNYYRDEEVIPVVTDRVYTLGINVSLMQFEDELLGTIGKAQRDKLETIIAHEMMHAMMFEGLMAGMIGRDHYHYERNAFPTWFVEGIAQAVGGGGDSLRTGLRISEDMTVEEIQSVLENYYLGKDSHHANYGSGYLALMYLGSHIHGKDSLLSDDIAVGLDRLLFGIRSGKSLDQAIKDYTKYEGITDFTNSFAKDAAPFTKRLLSEIGQLGQGALVADSYESGDILEDVSVEENIFILNTGKNAVINVYPEGHNTLNGGMADWPGLTGPGILVP